MRRGRWNGWPNEGREDSLLPSPLYSGERGWGRGGVDSGYRGSFPLSPNPSPPSTGERGAREKLFPLCSENASTESTRANFPTSSSVRSDVGRGLYSDHGS